MAPDSWNKFLFIIVVFVNLNLIVLTVPVTEQNEETIIEEACAQSNCKLGDVCYMAHPLYCEKFIMCQASEAKYTGIVMPCGFGTFWATTGEEACDRADLVNCQNDKCREKGRKNYNYLDDNPRTYYECRENKSYPACCPRFHRFDPQMEMCVNDTKVDDLCPLIRNETCRGRGVAAIEYEDGNCRTYYNCKSNKPHPVCCPENHAYDKVQEKCVPDSNCTDACPDVFKDCPSRAVEGKPDKYFNIVGDEMSCPVGTIYKDCGCDYPTGTTPVPSRRDDCPPALDVFPPDLENKGSVIAAILLVKGSLVDGTTFNTTASGYFNGTTALEIPYYGNQAPGKMYLDMILKPRSTDAKFPQLNQVLISSCHRYGDNLTFEISIDSHDITRRNITIRLSSKVSQLQMSHLIQLDQWSRLLLIYDGTKILTKVESLEMPEIPISTEIKDFTGSIQMATRAMRMGVCLREENKRSFVGDIYRFKFAKCVTKAQKELL